MAVSATLPAGRALEAQGPGLFDAYVSRKESTTNPLFGGIAISGYHGPFGIRGSGGLNFTSDEYTNTQQPATYACGRYRCRNAYVQNQPEGFFGLGVGGWTADVDVVFAPLRTLPVAKGLLLGFSPYAFVGIGGYGIRPSNAPDTTHATYSYGAGVHHDLVGWLGLAAEARYRHPFGSHSPISIGTSHDWEYRVGLSISFGGRSAQAQAATPPPNAPTVVSEDERPAPMVMERSKAETFERRTARLLDVAEGLIDTRYRRGGTAPAGFDAPGFVQYVFRQEGIRLPRSVAEMADVGDEVSTRTGLLRPGDLVFFASNGRDVDHVAIYVGHEKVIHCAAARGVRYDVLGEGETGEWLAEHLVTARRVLQ
jgi:cell wall-associated NlpC family hydrolase